MIISWQGSSLPFHLFKILSNYFPRAITWQMCIRDRSKAEGEKCPRCWHYTQDVGKVAEHAEICGRCVSNVAGDGEKRKFA